MTPLEILFLDVQGALLRAVTPTLRAVSADIDPHQKTITLCFFYDGKITNELFDLASVVATEAGISLPDYFTNNHIVRLDASDKLPLKGNFVYLRKEPLLPEIKKQNFSKDITPIAKLLLHLQQALLGRITPNLRLISTAIEEEKKRLYFYFFYDREISKENHDLACAAIIQTSEAFPEFAIEKQTKQIDFPNPIPDCGERYVYEKKEF